VRVTDQGSGRMRTNDVTELDCWKAQLCECNRRELCYEIPDAGN